MSLAFDPEEWELLDREQKTLYRQMVLENYRNLTFVGKPAAASIKMCALPPFCGAADVCVSVSAWAQAAGIRGQGSRPRLEGEGFILYP